MAKTEAFVRELVGTIDRGELRLPETTDTWNTSSYQCQLDSASAELRHCYPPQGEA